MIKLVSVSLLAVLVSSASFAAPSYITRNSDGGYNVTYDYRDKAKSGWYVTARAELSFLNWKNKYSTDDDYIGDAKYDSDKYSFEPVFGGNLSAGYHFGYFWRGEVEAGYIGYFNDKDSASEFELSVPYLMANGYYDFANGLYVGAGAGIAMPTTKLSGVIFSERESKTEVSPMAGVMLGWAHKLDDNLVLDIRYRLAGFGGTKQKIDFIDGRDFPHYLENKIGLVLDNSISLGLRYEF